jgi:hypothetical protein
MLGPEPRIVRLRHPAPRANGFRLDADQVARLDQLLFDTNANARSLLKPCRDGVKRKKEKEESPPRSPYPPCPREDT